MKKSEELKNNLQKVEKTLVVKKSKLENLTARKESLEKKMSELNIEVLEESIIVLQKLSERQREMAKIRLEELATEALRYSMGGEYSVIIDLENIRKRPQASLYICKKAYEDREEIDEEDLEDPLSDNGGGIVDVVSTAIELVVMQAQTPIIEGPLILDEPFKMLSEEYVPMMSDFLKKISKDFNRQIIMVTHDKYLAQSAKSKIVIE